MLSDPEVTGVVVVSVPEELAVSEAVDLLGRLESETTIEPAAVVVNMVPPPPLSPTDRRILEFLDPRLECGDLAKVVRAALLADRIRVEAAEVLGEAEPLLAVPVTHLNLPLVTGVSGEPELVAALADAVAAEIET